MAQRSLESPETTFLTDSNDIISEESRIKILITGRTGVGKSTLVNGIVGTKVADEGGSLKPKTTSVRKYETCKDGYEVVVWDSPGLQDGSVNEEEYLTEMKVKCTDVDVIIYCIKAADPRAKLGKEGNDFSAINKLTETFGKEWWKHAVFVLTFANALEEMLQVRALSVEKEFEKRIKGWEEKIHEALVSAGVRKAIAIKVPVVPAGHASKRHLPGKEYWLSSLWLHVVEQVKPQIAESLIVMNQTRIKKRGEVREDDFARPIHEQPIVIDADRVTLAIAAQVGLAVGATLGAVVGGIVGIGAGAAIGATVGGAAGTATGLATGGLISWLRKRKKLERVRRGDGI